MPQPDSLIVARRTSARRCAGPWESAVTILKAFRRRIIALEAMPRPKDGEPGRDGKDGLNGRDGKDGSVIKAMTVVDGDLIVDLEGGGVIKAGRVAGRDGKDAPPFEVELLEETEARLTAEDLGRLRMRRIRIGGHELHVLSIATE
jgi:hypothetical protein